MIIETFVVGKIMASIHEYLMLSEAFPDKVTTNVGFTDEAIIQGEAAVVKILM